MDGLDRIEQRIRAAARAEIASIEAQSAEQLSHALGVHSSFIYVLSLHMSITHIV